MSGVGFLYSVVPFYCGDFTQWVGLDDWLFKVSLLGSLCQCSGSWKWISSLWSAMECPVMSLRWVYVLGLTLGSLYVDTYIYVPVLLKNLCGMSCSGAYWLLGGGWFWCRYGGFWMVSYLLMFHVVRSFLVFSGLGLKSPASGFQFYSSNSLKTSPTIQH